MLGKAKQMPSRLKQHVLPFSSFVVFLRGFVVFLKTVLFFEEAKHIGNNQKEFTVCFPGLRKISL